MVGNLTFGNINIVRLNLIKDFPTNITDFTYQIKSITHLLCCQGGDRTHNLAVNSRSLCLIELPGTMWTWKESNLRPSPCKGDTLAAELQVPFPPKGLIPS